MTEKLNTLDVFIDYAGARVRVIWNPEVHLWYVYTEANTNRESFAVDRLELHTVGVYGELRPKFAPDGSPSFIGNVACSSIVTPKRGPTCKRLFAHPNAPAVVLFDDDEQKPFDQCRRLLLDGPSMWADTRQTRGTF